jgi:hypothetical protein
MLDDERARIAIYALRRNVLDMPGREAIALLRDAPMKKVTVAKEILRLAGDVEGNDAHGFIAETLNKPDLHRDVRIAGLRALWRYLERDDTWDALATAAQAEDPAIARSTIRIPQDRLSNAARARLAQHLTLLLDHPTPLVRLETLRRLVDLPVAGDSKLMDRLTRSLSQPIDVEVAAAASALALCAPLDALEDNVAARLGAIEPPRALQEIIAALGFLADMRAVARARAIAAGLVDALIAQRRCIGLAMRLAARTQPADVFHAAVERLAAESQLHPGAVSEAVAAAPLMASGRRAVGFADVEIAFGGHEDAGVRRIGLALLTGRAAATGWSDGARERLESYRRDSAPFVAEAAALTFPPPLE